MVFVVHLHQILLDLLCFPHPRTPKRRRSRTQTERHRLSRLGALAPSRGDHHLSSSAPARAVRFARGPGRSSHPARTACMVHAWHILDLVLDILLVVDLVRYEISERGQPVESSVPYRAILTRSTTSTVYTRISTPTSNISSTAVPASVLEYRYSI